MGQRSNTRAVLLFSTLLTFSYCVGMVGPQGSSFGTAETIQKGTFRYTLGRGQDHYFKVQLAPREWIFASLLSPIGSDFDLYLYDPSQQEVNHDTSTDQFNWVGGGKPEEIVGGTYYIKVKYYTGPGGEYELWVGPNVITSGSYRQSICEKGRTYYAIRGEAGWAAEIGMTQPPDTDQDIYFYDPDGELLVKSARYGAEPEQISTTLNKTGTHVICAKWYEGPGGDSQISVTVGPKVTVGIIGLPSSLRTTVSLGGRAAQEVVGGGSVGLIMPDGTMATISVSEDVMRTGQVRYHCYNPSWSPSTSSHDFNYVAQYWLETDNGGHGTVSPASGWHDQGESVEVSILTTTIMFGTDTRYSFQHWEGASTSSSSNVTLVMNSAKSMSAIWKIQYYLKVESERDNPTGEGWYDAGGTAQISVDGSVGFIPVRYVFDGWSGSGVVDPTSSSTLVDMSAPRVVAAHWREDYMYTIVAAACAIATIGAAVFLAIGRKPSAPRPPTYAPPPPPPT